MVVIMVDLSETSVDSGVFIGPGKPKNWQRDLTTVMASCAGPNPPTPAAVPKTTFCKIVQVHAAFWYRSDLLNGKYNWMRGGH